MRRFLLAALLAAASLARACPAHAQTPGGEIGSGGIGSGVSVPGGGGGPGNPGGGNTGGNTGGGGGGNAPTSTWVRHYWGDTSDPGYGTNAPILCPAGERAYEDVHVRVADGVVLNRINGCEAAPVVVTTTQPQPAPPTAAEARNLTPIPVPGWGVSPRGTGLTGLPTWLWDSNGDTPRTAASTIRGYSVTSTARPIRWTWDMADTGPASSSNPGSTLTATRPGTEGDPAARYVYETSGAYGLSLTVVWSGSYTYTWPGSTPVTVDLGTTTRSSTRAFTVDQVRPVLVSR